MDNLKTRSLAHIEDDTYWESCKTAASKLGTKPRWLAQRFHRAADIVDGVVIAVLDVAIGAKLGASWMAHVLTRDEAMELVGRSRRRAASDGPRSYARRPPAKTVKKTKHARR